MDDNKGFRTSSGEGRHVLVVNADDFGLTRGVSEGILRGHRDGIVTSTSVLPTGRAFESMCDRLRDYPQLGVGIHLAAVGEEPPLLPARSIPTLVDRRGRLRHSWRSFVRAATVGAIDAADIMCEFDAQAQRVMALGVPVTHVDAHQHLQLWPFVGDIVLDLAIRYDIPAIRVPRYRAPRLAALGVSALARRLTSRALRAGVLFPGQAVGIESAGHLDVGQLVRVIRQLTDRPDAVVEITVHPGEEPDPDLADYHWGYHWADELAAVTAPEVRSAVADSGVALGTYGDLVPAARAG